MVGEAEGAGAMMAEIVLPLDWDRWGPVLLASAGGIGALVGYAACLWVNRKARSRVGLHIEIHGAGGGGGRDLKQGIQGGGSGGDEPRREMGQGGAPWGPP